MSHAIDRRDHTADRATPQRLVELQEIAAQLSARLPGNPRLDVARVDSLTGNPALIGVGDLSSPAGSSLEQSALAHVEQLRALLGAAASSTFAASAPATASSGASSVPLRQQDQRIDIFDAALTARYSPDGALVAIAGRTLTVAGLGPAPPTVAAPAAVETAAGEHAAFAAELAGAVDAFGQPVRVPRVDPGQLGLRVVTVRSEPDRPTELADGPALRTPVRARLTWFGLGELRLGWEVEFATTGDDRAFRAVVDAADRTVLYWQPG